MPTRRRVLALRLIVAVTGTLLMIAALIGLKARLAMAREERAIASLVKAGAAVQWHNQPDATGFYEVGLAPCAGRVPNEQLLAWVADARHVAWLELAPVPLDEKCVKILLELKNLTGLDVTDAGLPDETVQRLKGQSPNLQFHDGRTDRWF